MTGADLNHEIHWQCHPFIYDLRAVNQTLNIHHPHSHSFTECALSTNFLVCKRHGIHLNVYFNSTYLLKLNLSDCPPHSFARPDTVMRCPSNAFVKSPPPHTRPLCSPYVGVDSKYPALTSSTDKTYIFSFIQKQSWHSFQFPMRSGVSYFSDLCKTSERVGTFCNKLNQVFFFAGMWHYLYYVLLWFCITWPEHFNLIVFWVTLVKCCEGASTTQIEKSVGFPKKPPWSNNCELMSCVIVVLNVK